eukprot:gene6655-9136_t
MPELPEVESARLHLEVNGLGHKITRFETKERGGGDRDGLFDDLVFCDNENVFLSNIAQSKQIYAVKRKGKYLWIEFENNSVLFHLGMTGYFLFKGIHVPIYKSRKITNIDQWPPKYAKFQLELSNGVCIALCDPRRLARIRIKDKNPLQTTPLSKLAIDPIIDPIPSTEMLHNKLSHYNCSIKSLLLDQEKVFCGIGNWIADEILYQSSIHPETNSNRISIEGVEVLVQNMVNILHIANEADAQYTLFPKEWMFHYRWEKRKSKTENILMENGKTVVFLTCGGRTSAIVPIKQIKNGGPYSIQSNNKTETIIKDIKNVKNKTKILKSFNKNNITENIKLNDKIKIKKDETNNNHNINMKLNSYNTRIQKRKLSEI